MSPSKTLVRPPKRSGQWIEDEKTGVLHPPAVIRKFLDWYVSLDHVGGRANLTVSEMSLATGVAGQHIKTWFKDPRFIAALNQRLHDINVRPDRIQAVLDSIWARAVGNGDMKAAELYLRYVGRLVPAPQKVDVTVTHVKDLSAEQLQVELERVRKAIDVTSTEET